MQGDIAPEPAAKFVNDGNANKAGYISIVFVSFLLMPVVNAMAIMDNSRFGRMLRDKNSIAVCNITGFLFILLLTPIITAPKNAFETIENITARKAVINFQLSNPPRYPFVDKRAHGPCSRNLVTPNDPANMEIP